MATNHDIEYISKELDVAFEAMSTSIDQIEGVSMVIDTAKIDVTTFDKDILKSIASQVTDAQNLLMCYLTQLNASKQ